MEWLSGIDSASHMGTIDANGKTIAVLGSGLKNIYPKENIDLYKKIITSGGLVISEYEPYVEAEAKRFLARNRIVSGISLGILIIEAAYRSGTSVTAKLAKEQEREVFVIPHEIEEIHGVGTNKLIQNGAKLITNTKEIIENFKFLTYKQIAKVPLNKEVKKKLNKKEYKEIYDIINQEVISINEIYQKSKKEKSEINNTLFMLELEGYIKKVAGGYSCILEET